VSGGFGGLSVFFRHPCGVSVRSRRTLKNQYVHLQCPFCCSNLFILYQNESSPLPKTRLENFCQKLPADAATAASALASAEALLAVRHWKVVDRPTNILSADFS
jgi:hypothetical protein